MEELYRLLDAWGTNDENCWFAIRDKLLEMGHDKVIPHHESCDHSQFTKIGCWLYEFGVAKRHLNLLPRYLEECQFEDSNETRLVREHLTP